jgi:hypothetical protein
VHDKHQTIEEPCEAKVSRTVLKTSGTGDSLAEFNIPRAPTEAWSFGEGFGCLRISL